MQPSNLNQLPSLSDTQIIQYLSSGLFKGIGKKTAALLVAHFGTQTLTILDTAPEELTQIPKLPAYRITTITTSWQESKSNPARAAAALLLGKGTSLGLTLKICEHYADNTLAVVVNDPYRLIDDIDGVGFKTADDLALSLGMTPDSPLGYHKYEQLAANVVRVT